eukprot:4598273-Pleurochrysis_carterae.AAC.1
MGTPASNTVDRLNPCVVPVSLSVWNASCSNVWAPLNFLPHTCMRNVLLSVRQTVVWILTVLTRTRAAGPAGSAMCKKLSSNSP